MTELNEQVKKYAIATGGKLAVSNQVATCLNGQYGNPVASDPTLNMPGIIPRQMGLMNVNTQKLRPSLKLAKELVPTFNDATIINLSDDIYNNIIDSLNDDQKKIRESSNNAKNLINSTTSIDDIKKIDPYLLSLLPKSVLSTLTPTQLDAIYKIVVPRWKDEDIINLRPMDFIFLRKYMYSNQVYLYLLDKTRSENIDYIYTILVPTLINPYIISLTAKEYSYLSKYMTQVQKELYLYNLKNQRYI
jgi:hypothetical protein